VSQEPCFVSKRCDEQCQRNADIRGGLGVSDRESFVFESGYRIGDDQGGSKEATPGSTVCPTLAADFYNLPPPSTCTQHGSD